ncbi:MAG TPA: response regulator transcription factor [Anaerolineaceae bacterium]|jgi:DNA-binding NarL/FixJ family response regulator
MTIRVLLAEDHKIVREGTRQLLQQAPDLEIVAETADGAEAIRLAQALTPDVIVMDVRMPGLNGLEATRAIKARSQAVRVLILSAYDDDRYIFPLLDAGASGYLLKTSSGSELVDAIRVVHSGGTVFSSQISGKVLQRATGHLPGRAGGLPESLTEREMEVLRQAALGRSNKAIAGALSISPQTVQVHLRNIFGKLGVSSRSEATALGLSRGWIRLEMEDE